MRTGVSTPMPDISSKRIEAICNGRRRFIAGIAAAGVGSLASPFAFDLPSAQTQAAPNRRLIDVHHHFVPPFYVSENKDRILASGGGQNPAWWKWSPDTAIAAMDKNGVSTAVLSLTFPGVWFGNPHEAAEMARRVNEYAAELAQNHPGRFGVFATIPLPDPETSLREIEYAFTVLKADGIGVLTSYDDKWLGNSAYKPVFEELHRRKAVVFVHPTVPSCCRALLPEVAPVIAEVPQDTTRAVTNLLFTGTFSRFKDIRFIFPHAGGDVPMIAGRMQDYAPKDIVQKAPNGIEYELKRLHYDIAGTAFRPASAALMSLVPTTQILFGSDDPFVPLAKTAEGIMQLDLPGADLQRIGRENALSLLPRLRPT